MKRKITTLQESYLFFAVFATYHILDYVVSSFKNSEPIVALGFVDPIARSAFSAVLYFAFITMYKKWTRNRYEA